MSKRKTEHNGEYMVLTNEGRAFIHNMLQAQQQLVRERYTAYLVAEAELDERKKALVCDHDLKHAGGTIRTIIHCDKCHFNWVD